MRTGSNDPAPECDELGPVTGNADHLAGGDKNAIKHIKNNTFKLGGNYAKINWKSKSDVLASSWVTAMAYKCP